MRGSGLSPDEEQHERSIDGLRPTDEQTVEMSVPAETEEEPLEVLHQNQLSSDQAHIMPQLFGWLSPGEQRERARYLSDLTRPRTSRSPRYPGRGWLEGEMPGETAEEHANPTINT